MAKRRYSKDFRQTAVERLRGCENIVAGPGENGRASTLRKEVNHLKRVLAEKTLEVDFFKSALQKVEARRQQSSRSGAEFGKV